MADTIEVANCEDSGTGSLRDAVGSAVSGDTVDASALTCGKITMTSGEIAIGVDDLTIVGPGIDALFIDAQGKSRALNHTGAGTLNLQALTVSRGSYSKDDSARGGCIYSGANVSLVDVTIFACEVSGITQPSGGGIFVGGTLYMDRSRLIDNLSIASGMAPHPNGSTPAASAMGGGASSYRIIANRSTISGNSAHSTTDTYTFGGGLFVGPNPFVKVTTIDHNHADRGGGIALLGPGTPNFNMDTISSNSATISGGGIYSLSSLTIRNTTIAFNQSGASGGGIYQYGFLRTLSMDNVIVASNVATDNALDADIGGVVDIFSQSSIVMQTTLPLPPDTIRDDPLLLPLADNGGFSRTHAIPDNSPAVDRGINENTTCDERGFPRVYGAEQDIGAYEYQGDRFMFSNFEICLPAGP